MIQYMIRRMLWALPLLFGITLVSYFVVSLAPGSPVDSLIDPGMSEMDKIVMKRQFGLDQPVYVQYFKWLGQLLRGNMGYSYLNYRPVADKIAERIPPTLLIMASSMVMAYLIAIPIGVLSATKQYSAMDYASTLFAFLGISLPSFFLGLAGIYIFGLRLGLLPTGGMRTLGVPPTAGDLLLHLILPTAVLSFLNMGSVVRYARSSMLEVVRQDYIRTARAKGLSERVVIYRHALRNALIPVITLIGLQLPNLMGGAVITEQIFQWPGMGRLTIEAINQRDYPTIMGLTLLTAILVIIGGLITDIVYSIVDPRIRYS